MCLFKSKYCICYFCFVKDTPNPSEPAALCRDEEVESKTLSKYHDHIRETEGAQEEGSRSAVRSKGVLAYIDSTDGALIDTVGAG